MWINRSWREVRSPRARTKLDTGLFVTHNIQGEASGGLGDDSLGSQTAFGLTASHADPPPAEVTPTKPEPPRSAMIGPSPHLSWSELACHDGVVYPLKWRGSRALVLAREFERIRSACGDVPIRVLSAYRTPIHNQKVGGSPKSQHLQGRALDLAIPDGWSRVGFELACRRVAKEPFSQIRGVGVYAWGCHVDTRPAEKLVEWTL